MPTVRKPPSRLVVSTDSTSFSEEDLKPALAVLEPANQSQAAAIILEWLQSTTRSKNALNTQSQKTTPKSVLVAIRDLRRKIKPFTDSGLGIDNDTFDALNSLAKSLDEAAAKREKELIEHPKTQDREFLKTSASYISLIYNSCASKKSETSRRRFASLLLDMAEIRHPDPMNDGKGLDEFLDSPAPKM